MFCYYRVWATIFSPLPLMISSAHFKSLPTFLCHSFRSCQQTPYTSQASICYPIIKPMPRIWGFYHIYATLLGHKFSISYLIIHNNTPTICGLKQWFHVSHDSVNQICPITYLGWFCLGSFTCMNLVVELAESYVKLEWLSLCLHVAFHSQQV